MTSLEADALPLALGGDHSLAAGSVAATAADAQRRRKRIGLVWVDAHGDMNTPATTTSGNVHGMPLAALLGPEPAELSRIGEFSPTVAPAKTVLVGVRNLDPAEKQQVLDSGVHVFTMNDIDRRGIAAVSEEAIALAAKGTAGERQHRRCRNYRHFGLRVGALLHDRVERDDSHGPEGRETGWARTAVQTVRPSAPSGTSPYSTCRPDRYPEVKLPAPIPIASVPMK